MGPGYKDCFRINVPLSITLFIDMHVKFLILPAKVNKPVVLCWQHIPYS